MDKGRSKSWQASNEKVNGNRQRSWYRRALKHSGQEMWRGKIRGSANVVSGTGCDIQWGSRDGGATEGKGSHVGQCLVLTDPGTRGRRWHGGIRKAHTGRTWGTCGITGMGTPWPVVRTSCVALGKFRPFPPHLYCLVHSRGSMCSGTVLSSALYKTDSNKISLGNILFICYF